MQTRYDTLRTKSIPRNHVKAWATPQHPAQVEVYYEDVTVSYWKSIRLSGVQPAKKVNEQVSCVEEPQQAVKFARETANSAAAKDVKVGEATVGYIFAA